MIVKIEGIPYFGENTIEIEEHIKNLDISHSITYSDMIDLMDNELTENKIVIIEDEDGVWLTYLRDIKFNYRDKEVYLPYFSYEVKSIDKGKLKSNYKGHLIIKEDTISIRYNYKLKVKDISIENNSILLYDFVTDKKYKVYFDKWYSKTEWSMSNLYNLYLNSCVIEDDYLLVKHTEGYHLINKNLPNIKNKEKELRQKENLNHTEESDIGLSKLNYRAVRNYTYDQFIKLHGFIDLEIPYWLRLLKFEYNNYCLMRSNIIPYDINKDEWNKLGKSKNIFKYGDKIKLIIKDYWLDNIDKNIDKTYIKN